MGLPGPDLTDGLREMVRKLRPGGLILFGRNIAAPGQVHRLIREFCDLAGGRPIITLDQEGGRVSRLARIGALPPSGQELCRAGSPDLCRRHGELTGDLMRTLGFNLNLAPVVDWSPDETADNSLRGRCLGRDPQEVVRNAGAFLDGMASRGVQGTIKHFPGYTYCGRDPHGALPRIDRTREQLAAAELEVFGALRRAACVMAGHAHFPAFHADPYPASLSRPIIHGLLREHLHYDGAVMTDDLEMGAVAWSYPAAAATRLAIEAGNDLLLFCHNPACAQIAHDTLLVMPETTLAPSSARIDTLAAQLLPPPETFDPAAFADINKQIDNLRREVLT